MCSQLVSGFGGRAEALLCSGAGGWRLGVANGASARGGHGQRWAAMGGVLPFADYLKVCFLIVLLCYLKAFAVCRTLDRMRLRWHLLEVDRRLGIRQRASHEAVCCKCNAARSSDERRAAFRYLLAVVV